MMKFNKKILRTLIISLIMTSLVACSFQSNRTSREIVENVGNEIDDGITKINQIEDCELKEFDIYEIKSKQSIYTFLRFKDPVVANREGNSYYSKSSIQADMSVTIIEGDDYSNNTMQEVIDKMTSYIQDTTKSQYQEDKTTAYKFINYKMYGEDKDKIIVCVKTDIGYIVHDFSYFASGTPEELKLIKAYIEDMCIALGITI